MPPIKPKLSQILAGAGRGAANDGAFLKAKPPAGLPFASDPPRADWLNYSASHFQPEKPWKKFHEQTLPLAQANDGVMPGGLLPPQEDYVSRNARRLMNFQRRGQNAEASALIAKMRREHSPADLVDEIKWRARNGTPGGGLPENVRNEATSALTGRKDRLAFEKTPRGRAEVNWGLSDATTQAFGIRPPRGTGLAIGAAATGAALSPGDAEAAPWRKPKMPWERALSGKPTDARMTPNQLLFARPHGERAARILSEKDAKLKAGQQAFSNLNQSTRDAFGAMGYDHPLEGMDAAYAKGDDNALTARHYLDPRTDVPFGELDPEDLSAAQLKHGVGFDRVGPVQDALSEARATDWQSRVGDRLTRPDFNPPRNRYNALPFVLGAGAAAGSAFAPDNAQAAPFKPRIPRAISPDAFSTGNAFADALVPAKPVRFALAPGAHQYVRKYDINTPYGDGARLRANRLPATDFEEKWVPGSLQADRRMLSWGTDARGLDDRQRAAQALSALRGVRDAVSHDAKTFRPHSYEFATANNGLAPIYDHANTALKSAGYSPTIGTRVRQAGRALGLKSDRGWEYKRNISLLPALVAGGAATLAPEDADAARLRPPSRINPELFTSGNVFADSLVTPKPVRDAWKAEEGYAASRANKRGAASGAQVPHDLEAIAAEPDIRTANVQRNGVGKIGVGADLFRGGGAIQSKVDPRVFAGLAGAGATAGAGAALMQSPMAKRAQEDAWLSDAKARTDALFEGLGYPKLQSDPSGRQQLAKPRPEAQLRAAPANLFEKAAPFARAVTDTFARGVNPVGSQLFGTPAEMAEEYASAPGKTMIQTLDPTGMSMGLWPGDTANDDYRGRGKRPYQPPMSPEEFLAETWRKGLLGKTLTLPQSEYARR